MRPHPLALAASLFAAASVSAAPKVLLCVDDGGDGGGVDMQNQLKALKSFDVVDYMDCGAKIPTLAQLKTYDAVLSFDAGGFADPKTLGDSLADYVDAGGGVVQMMFNFDNFDDLDLKGRWSTANYNCILPQDIEFNLAGLKAKPNEPQSPLVQGVTNIKSDLRATGGLNKAGGAISVWDWDDGVPAVCRMTVKGRPRVDISFYPGLKAFSEGMPGDAARLVRNSLLFVSGGFSPLQGTPNPAAFPDTGTGAASNPVTITYKNGGMKQETVTGVVIGGTDKGDFAIAKLPALPLALAVGASFTVDVLFKPTIAGARQATLQAAIANNMATADVALTGKATPAQIAVMPFPISLGGTQIGKPLSKPVTITNLGAGKVNVMSAGITVGAPAFSTANAPGFPITLVGGGSVSLNVVFNPVMAGAQMGVFTVTSNDPNSPKLDVPVTGCAGPGQISVDAGSLAYGNVNLGATVPQTITITNSGCADLTAIDAVMGGAHAGDFIIDKLNLMKTVGAGLSTPLSVSFKPTAVGMRTAMVTISSSAGNKVVNLLGNGTTAMMKLTPGALDFKAVRLKAMSMPQNVTISNMGTGVLKVNAVTFGGKDAASFSSPGFMPLTIGPNLNAVLPVVCAPQLLGVLAGTMTVVSDVGSQIVTLAATGTAPVITVAPLALDFGLQAVNLASKEKVVTITNSGTDVLTIKDVSIGGADSGDFVFSVMPKLGALAPKAASTFSVVFNPTTNLAETATVLIESDDPVKPAVTVTMKGKGVEARLEVLPPDMLDFGTVQQGASKVQTVTLDNTGDGAITIKAITVSGQGSPSFSVDMAGPLTLAMGKAATVKVSFAPQASGPLSATLNIVPMNLPAVPIALTGTGSAPGVQLSPISFDFGPVEVMTASMPLMVTVKNTGATTLVFEPVVSGDSNFTIEGGEALMLPAAGMASFAITFKPLSANTFNGKIGVALKGQAKPVATVSVTGTGVTPKVRPPASGCRCTVGGHGGRSATTPAPLLALALLALLLLRRRRRA